MSNPMLRCAREVWVVFERGRLRRTQELGVFRCGIARPRLRRRLCHNRKTPRMQLLTYWLLSALGNADCGVAGNAGVVATSAFPQTAYAARHPRSKNNTRPGNPLPAMCLRCAEEAGDD